MSQDRLRDGALKHALGFGVGFLHESMAPGDQAVVNHLFNAGAVQVRRGAAQLGCSCDAAQCVCDHVLQHGHGACTRRLWRAVQCVYNACAMQRSAFATASSMRALSRCGAVQRSWGAFAMRCNALATTCSVRALCSRVAAWLRHSYLGTSDVCSSVHGLGVHVAWPDNALALRRTNGFVAAFTTHNF